MDEESGESTEEDEVADVCGKNRADIVHEARD